MDAEVIRSILEAIGKPTEVTRDGDLYTLLPPGWQQVRTKLDQVEKLEAHSLQAVVDYLAFEPSPSKAVLLFSQVALCVYGLLGERQSRAYYLLSTPYIPTITYGQFIDPEQFVIQLQTCFVPTPGRDALVAMVSSISDDLKGSTDDDGVSQTVAVRKGLTLSANQKIPNPVTLAPYASFSEIEQVARPFVLRARASGGNKPMLALFEAGGTGWKIEALARIRAWLTERLPKGTSIIG